MSQPRPCMLHRVLGRISALLLALLLMVVFYVAVIMADPKEEAMAVQQDQPLLAASPAVTIDKEEDMTTLLASFPVPVLCCAGGSGLTFVGGTSYDMAFEGGFARIAQVTYAAQDGTHVTASTIYPARAISLLGKADYRLSDQSGASIAGMATVRMENDSTIRLHVQGEEGLYAFTAPQVEATTLATLVRPFQLLSNP